MRIVFMGTPDIAASCLEALYAAGHDIPSFSPAPCGTAARTPTCRPWPPI